MKGDWLNLNVLHPRYVRASAPAVLVALTLFPAVAATGPRVLDACKGGARLAQIACQTGARGDFSLALGACLNNADATARRTCQTQARTVLKEDLGDCKDQADARRSTCDDLGSDPYDPPIDPAQFAEGIDNPFMPLVPGTTFVYVDLAGTGDERNVVEVTHNTKVIMGVTCVEVHDTVYTLGVLTEDTRDWFAQDTAGNVWYFGENSQELQDGLPVSLEGSWTGGVDGARPGIVMEAHPAAGDFYRQEFLLGTAEDNARVQGLGESLTVPAGTYVSCLKTEETSPLEPDALEHKYYAPGVGLVLDVDDETGEHLELTEITTGH